MAESQDMSEQASNGTLYTLEVMTDSDDWDTIHIRAESKSDAIKQAAEYSAWEIGVRGKFEDGFQHFTVFAESLEKAEEKVLESDQNASDVIDNSQFCLGDVVSVELRGEA